MLILTRKVGQRVLIGSDIRVTVLKSRGRSVQLGIEAPRATAVAREELERQSVDSGSSSSLPVDPAAAEPVDQPRSR